MPPSDTILARAIKAVLDEPVANDPATDSYDDFENFEQAKDKLRRIKQMVEEQVNSSSHVQERPEPLEPPSEVYGTVQQTWDEANHRWNYTAQDGTRLVPCHECEGTGHHTSTCEVCDGDGFEIEHRQVDLTTCTSCGQPLANQPIVGNDEDGYEHLTCYEQAMVRNHTTRNNTPPVEEDEDNIIDCPRCDGSGAIYTGDGETDTCPDCEGTGRIESE